MQLAAEKSFSGNPVNGRALLPGFDDSHRVN